MNLQQVLFPLHAMPVPQDHHISLTRTYLSNEIETASHAASLRMALNPDYLLGRVFPASGARFPWRSWEVEMWRLEHELPVWLGADGVIYLGHEVDTWGDEEFPQYLLPLQLESLGIPELQQILSAVRSLASRAE